MPRVRLPAAGLLVFPTLLLGCVDPSERDDLSDFRAATVDVPPAPASDRAAPDTAHADAFAHLDAQRVDAWWTEIEGERGTATIAVRASTAPDNTYEAEIRALFGPLERSWTVDAPAVAAGEVFELSIPLGRLAGLHPLQADHTTELLVQVRAYGPDGALRDTRPLPVRHLLLDDDALMPLTDAELAVHAPRGVRGLPAALPAAGPDEEPTVETRVVPPVLLTPAQ